MKKYLSFLLVFSCLLCQSQTIDFNQDLSINKRVLEDKTPAKDSVIEFMRVFHKALFSNSVNKNVFFTKETNENYANPVYIIQSEFYGYDLSKIKPNILVIHRPELNYRAVQVGYSYYDTISKNTSVFCVYTYAVTKENDSCKIFPILNTYKFQQYKNDFITYNNIDSSASNARFLDTLTNYNTKLANFFNTNTIKATCYQFRDFAQLNTCVGLDVAHSYTRIEKNAYADASNAIIYSTGSKDYFHELVHLYVGKDYVAYCNEWINEGLATYLGDSYLSLDEHLKNLAVDLKKHPEYDLNDFLQYKEKFTDLADIKHMTGYEYTLGGLICKLAYEKKGFEGLHTLMSAGIEKEKVYQAIEKVLGIKQKNFNTYFRK